MSPHIAQQVIERWARSTDGQSPLIIAHHSQADVGALIADVATKMFGDTKPANNPDILVWQPEKATITIKEVRGWLDQLIRTPFKDHRLVAVANIEKLSQPAANALLKSLEEPSATTKWLLLTAYPRQLLPTILSRSQMVRVSSAKRSLEHTDELHSAFQQLHQLLQAEGPTPAVRRGYLRLRDYYMIRSRRGNTKLAREILELSLPFSI